MPKAESRTDAMRARCLRRGRLVRLKAGAFRQITTPSCDRIATIARPAGQDRRKRANPDVV
jgi:hypothetical protein